MVGAERAPGDNSDGAICVRGSDFTETDAFLEYIRPVINRQLSDFIIELTGISQEDIDSKSISYLEGVKKLKDFIGDTPAFCWGKDIEVLEENSKLVNTPETLSPKQFKNLRPLLKKDFSDVGIDIDSYSSGTLIQAFGKDTGRRAHDAVNDMRNLLEAITSLEN